MGSYAIIEANETVQGLALLANRDLQDEELFLNYRLNPSVMRPEWYTPVDEKEDILRWS